MKQDDEQENQGELIEGAKEEVNKNLSDTESNIFTQILRQGLEKIPFLVLFTLIGLLVAICVSLVTLHIAYITFPATMVVFLIIGSYLNRRVN